MMRVLVTGSNGFIGKNLLVHLRQQTGMEVSTFQSDESLEALAHKVAQSDFVFHLAGVNRPQSDLEFASGNTDLTRALCVAVENSGRKIPIVYTSSIQAQRDNAYGTSKYLAEEALRDFSRKTGTPVHIYRLPNVFGKWARPNYNSVVATFCHNIAHDLPIQINDRTSLIKLIYVDDVVSEFLSVLKDKPDPVDFHQVQPVYEITVGDLADLLGKFRDSRQNMITAPVGVGLVRALYSTYISYYTPDQFSYPLIKHEDPRGVFVEMLKTEDSGQFSYFTAGPGVTRGGHYHHTKTEKFLVIKGEARFGFRHIVTGATYELFSNGKAPMVVETIPGWSHDITNIGDEEMVVMLWANEIFDRAHPDTVAYKV